MKILVRKGGYFTARWHCVPLAIAAVPRRRLGSSLLADMAFAASCVLLQSSVEFEVLLTSTADSHLVLISAAH